MRFSVGLFLVLSAAAQVVAPEAGWAVDALQTVRPVMGFAGNLWMSRGVYQGAVSASFSGRGGIVKCLDSFAVLNPQGVVIRSAPAPAGPAIFGFTAQGTPALVFFPATKELVRIRGRRLSPVALNPAVADGDVLSLTQSDTKRTDFVVRRGGTLWMIRVDLAAKFIVFQTPLPRVSEPVLLQSGGRLFFARGKSLVTRSADGTETTLPVAFTPAALGGMGTGLLTVTELDGSRRYVWNPGAHQISQLPQEAAQ